MSDLIRRSALLAEYDKHHVGAPGGARKLIEEATTIDAVPVVRCNDCKYCADRGKYLRCTRMGFANGYEVKADGFCSYGERMDNEN